MKITVNDAALAYDDAGAGPPVVLLHGYPLCRRMWRPQLTALAAAGWRAVAPDLRGFGESEPGDRPFSIDLFADDVAGLLDRLGIERAVVAGMSMGGYVLLNLLERHRSRLAAAAFVVTRAAADDEPGRARRTALAAEVEKGKPGVVTDAFASILFAEATPERQPGLVAEVRQWLASAHRRGLAGGLLAMRDRRDCVDLLPAFDLPALVVGAGADRAIPVEHSRALAAGLPQARLCLIPGAGHLANLERPGEFNRCLLEFLARLGGGSR